MGVEALVAASLGSLAYQVYAGEEGRKAQRKAQQEAQAQAVKQEKAADEAYNAAHKKQPNIPGALQSAGSMADQGSAGTMLTGAGFEAPGATGGSSALGGANVPGNLQMKKNTLLGQ